MDSSKKTDAQIHHSAGASKQRRVIGLGSATGICLASMIGSGIFTVTGVVGAGRGSVTNLTVAWIIAAVIALAGKGWPDGWTAGSFPSSVLWRGRKADLLYSISSLTRCR